MRTERKGATCFGMAIFTLVVALGFGPVDVAC
jgi:hypothetical protein